MGRVKGVLTTADYLEIDEFNRLMDCLRKDGEFLWELYCRLSFCTAMRISDVLSLKWKDFLHKSEICETERKTGKVRKIKINDSVKGKLAELYYLLGRPDVEQFAILNPQTEMPYTSVHINRVLKGFKFKYRLSIGAFSSHTFRKTFGRYVYESQGRSAESLILLNTIFKHSNLEITKIYIGIRQNEIDNVFDSISF